MPHRLLRGDIDTTFDIINRIYQNKYRVCKKKNPDIVRYYLLPNSTALKLTKNKVAYIYIYIYIYIYTYK